MDNNAKVKIYVRGRSYLLSEWKKVYPALTPRDMTLMSNGDIKILVKSSSSNKIHTVTRKLHPLNHIQCTCWGYKRAKDGRCKHIKQVFPNYVGKL